jgi:hypothetical protein
MSYKVQFLGLVCFYRDAEGHLAMLPDGRDPGDGIDPHYASIAVDPDEIIDASGWDAHSIASGMLRLPPCAITMDGLEAPGHLDTSAHDGRLPRLGRIDPNFHIDPSTAQTIATISIRQGTLVAYVVPSGTAVMSELEVPHEEDIRITVTPHEGPTRHLLVRSGTEIAITNTAGDYRRGAVREDHFRIYEKLSSRPVTLAAPPDVDRNLRESPSAHFLFTEGVSIALTADCSNTGCCP